MIQYKKENCCGCGACMQSCPRCCISLETDMEGFLYPITNISKCIQCGKCVQVCPIINNKQEQDSFIGAKNTRLKKEIYPVAFAGHHKNESIRYDSSSGGAFTLFAEAILAQGGIVYGCTLNEDLEAIHVGVETIDGLAKLRGSKYVQSKIGYVYENIRKALGKGRKVLFVGTPCQAAGLINYIGRKDNNLFVMDFICHGVPSPMIFSSFLRAEEAKYKSKIVMHKFRNKDKGWNQSGIQLGTSSYFADGTYVRRFPAFIDKYMNGFLEDLFLRPSCYSCKFKSLPKLYADVTVADFWQLNKSCPELNDHKGTSLIIIHNEQAMSLWNQVKYNCVFKKVDFEIAIAGNKSIIKSARANNQRENFYKEYYEKGYDYVSKKYMTALTWVFHKIFKL